MSESFLDLTKETSKYVSELKLLAPESMNGFYNLSSNAIKDGALSKKQKELMAISEVVRYLPKWVYVYIKKE